MIDADQGGSENAIEEDQNLPNSSIAASDEGGCSRVSKFCVSVYESLHYLFCNLLKERNEHETSADGANRNQG